MKGFNVRWVFMGVCLFYLVVFIGEKAVWSLVPKDTSVFLNQAIDRVGQQDISDEEKVLIRQETLNRLAIPSVITVAVIILITPLLIGTLFVFKKLCFYNAFFAVLIGGLGALSVSGAISAAGVFAVVLASVFALLPFGVKRSYEIIKKNVQNRI